MRDRGSWWDQLRSQLGLGGRRRPPPSARYAARPVSRMPGARRYAEPPEPSPFRGARAGRHDTRRHPAYGTQARRQDSYAPYAIGFLLIIGALAAFLYVGLNWATGSGRTLGLGSPPTPIPTLAPSPVAVVAASPSPVEQTYVVKAGDNPAEIARQFRITADELMAANGIDDPSKLQIGQTLRIPPPRR